MVMKAAAAGGIHRPRLPSSSSSGGNSNSNNNNSTTAATTTTTTTKTPLRRRRSKGTIAGYAEVLATAPSSLSQQSSTLPAKSSSEAQIDNPLPSFAQHSHSARLALLCVHNALRMGARTQLALCPPGRARRLLQAELRNRGGSAAKHVRTASSSIPEHTILLEQMVDAEAYDAVEHDFLISTNTYTVDSDEEASSGDEDELPEFMGESSSSSVQYDYAQQLNEPLYTPNDSAAAAAAPVAQQNVSSKLPFCRRKLRYFDRVASSDSTIARNYLKRELARLKRQSVVQLQRHLRSIQQQGGAAAFTTGTTNTTTTTTTTTTASTDNQLVPQQPHEYDQITRFHEEMTPEMAAALLLESLALNRTEAVEGMAKCYDGIVAAGVAVLETMDANTSPSDKSRPTREQIIAALAPLLITSLEPMSGEVILGLAQLRKLCGTLRYQRRFCQRIAPALVRPPNASIWCLRQQHDMEAIVAATELLLDQAPHIFSKGWYERGRLWLADNKRAETLNYAAQQLRELSSENTNSLLSSGGHHNNRLRRKATDAEPLAEWEVMAVDYQIRTTIATALTTDWSRSAVSRQPPLQRRTTNTAASSSNTAAAARPVRQEHSPIPSSPRSPATRKSPSPQPPTTPKSPPHMPDTSMEQVFGPAFASQSIDHVVRNDSATTAPATATTAAVSTAAAAASVTLTPPRSPKSPTRERVDTASSPLPQRGTIGGSAQQQQQQPPTSLSAPTTPLSPSSVGTSGSIEIATSRPTTTNTSSGGPSHYRMLTSTAAERKRTVAACRALRAQIQRFEDAFVQLHGRSPRGTAERAPLATTYAQYREWKRAIRADAACRIQALMRGFWARTLLLRSGRPEVTDFMRRRARRFLVDLQMPVDDYPGSGSSPTSSSSGVSNTGPHWNTRVRPRNSTSPTASPRTASNLPVPAPSSPLSLNATAPTLGTMAAAPTTPPLDLNNMTLTELQTQKRELKNRLKQYDMKFARQHGRMPVKAEKEPIRNLYESYNALKTQISNMEQRRKPSSASFSPSRMTPMHQRAVSPTSGSESGHSGTEDSSTHSNSPLPITRSRRKVPATGSSPPIGNSSSTAVAAGGAPAQDLQALKLEKGALHQMLRKFEKEFFAQHRRQVSSFSDIRPVASQYRRYKEIKKQIANLQRTRRPG